MSVNMWEPFTKPAREAIIRAEEVAQLFGSRYVGTEHVLFALAERDDPLGHEFAQSVNRTAIRDRLGAVHESPQADMAFTDAVKHAIELAFGHARRLDQSFISTPHLALGLLDAEPPALRPEVTMERLRLAIEEIARGEKPL